MENYINITQVLAGVVTVIVCIWKFVVPLIKSKITKSQWDNLTNWANIFVRAAEVLIHGTTGLGAKRREQVMAKLQELCNKHGYKFDETDLRAALENAWGDMTGKTSKEGKTDNTTTSA